MRGIDGGKQQDRPPATRPHRQTDPNPKLHALGEFMELSLRHSCAV